MNISCHKSATEEQNISLQTPGIKVFVPETRPSQNLENPHDT